jgi:hypothetical protein
MERNEQIVAEQVEQIRSSLSEQVDTYLNYVVEQWMEQNQVAIDSGIRSEIASDFISGLKNLFTEHYIEVPEEKVDLVEELAEQIVDLEEVINEQANDVVAVTAKLNEALKNETVRKICEGLTEVQIGKMKSLAEGVEFTTEGEYFDKLAVIRENYFPTKKLVSEVKKVESETSEEQPEVEGRLGIYVNAITKTLPKF